MSDEFIHPFADGNGRLGRLWQTLILEQWNPLLGQLPVESMVHNHKQAYYRAINSSTQQTDSSPFIEFMLGVIVETIDSGSAPTPQVSKLITVLNKSQSAMNRAGLQQALALKDRHSFRERYLKPALAAGLVEMTIADKPNSRLQQYQLTARGKKLAESFG